MDGAITSENLIAELLRQFPELKSAVADVGKINDDDSFLNYTVFGGIFLPVFKRNLEEGTPTEFLQRSGVFIESVCMSGDAEAINVIWVKLFEYLLFQPSKLRLLWPMLGPASRDELRDAAARWDAVDVIPRT